MNPITNIAIGIVIASVAGIGGYSKGYLSGKATVQQQWDKEKAEQYAAYAKGQEEARQREQEMQAAADKLRRDKDAEIRNINARSIGLIASLRDRPDRATENGAMPDTARSCSGSTGAELAKRDAEFLAGYSTDAARIDAALEQCIKQYNQVRALLKN